MEAGPYNIQDVGSTSNLVENEDEEFCHKCYYFCCHPNGKFHRFIALTFMCFLGFGSYFCYDNPAALQDHMKNDLNITETQYTMLYSIYSWPNVILCFIGGFLIDRVFGIRFGTNIYMGLTLCGQLFVSTGVLLNMYWLMVAGRFIFGIGAESLAVAGNNYAVLWFKGKELNMVFGLQLSFARIGSTVNFLVMESIYNWVHNGYSGPKALGIVFFVAAITCVFSMFCALTLGVLDKRAERITNRNQTNSGGDVVRLQDVIKFKATFWLVTVICVSFYVAIFPFITLAEDFFIQKFKMDTQKANSISSLVYLISGFASPVLGFLIDKTGRNVTWIVVAICATIGAHVMLGFTTFNPYIGMVLMGLSYSTLASSLWPLVALIIPEYQLGTAYGVCQAVQNLGLAVIAIITGIIVEKYGYTSLEIFFVGCLLVALCATIILWILDNVRVETLNMSPRDRSNRQQSVLAAQILERQKLLSAEGSSQDTSEILSPKTDSDIRNKYLSKVGAKATSYGTYQEN